MAATIVWDGDTSDAWSNGNNWTGDAVPDTADTAEFDGADAGATVDFDASDTIATLDFTGANTAATAHTVTIADGQTLTIGTGINVAAAVSGIQTVTNAATGILSLADATTITVDGTAGGSLVLGGLINLDGTTAITTTNGAAASELTIDGVIADGGGTGILTIAGDGTVTLNGNNAFTGGTTITATGTVALGHSSALGTGAVAINEDSTYNLADTIDVANAIAVLGTKTATVVIASGEAAELSGVISGAGALTFSGADGTAELTLSGTNVFTGGVTLNQGILILDAAAGLGTGALTVGHATNSTLEIANGLTIANNVDTGAGNDLIVDVANGETATMSGIISNTGGLSMATNGGTLVLSGANTFTGTLDIDDGTVNVTGSLADTATVDVANQAGAIYGVGATDTIGILTTGAAGVVNLGAGATLTVSGAGASNVAGVVEGTGNLTFNANGQTLTLGGANTFTGTLTVTDGTVDVTGSLADTADVVVANLATATYSVEASDTIGALTTGAAGIVELNANDLTVTEASTVSGVVQGTGNLLFNSAGNTMVLGGANTFTGDLTITSGTVNVTGTLDDAVDVVIADATGTYTVGQDDAINGLTTNAGTVNLGTNTLSPGAATTIEAGTINISAAGVDSAAGAQDGNYGSIHCTAGGLTLDTDTTTINLTVTGNLADGGTLDILIDDAAAITDNGAGADITGITLVENSATLDFVISAENTQGAADDTLRLTVNRTGYVGVNTSTSSNVTQLVTVLDAIQVAGGGAALIGALDNLNASDMNTAFEQLTPEACAATASVAMVAGGAFSGSQMGRTGDVRLAMSNDAPRGPAGPTGAYGQGIGVWAKTFGSWYDQDKRNGYNGYEVDTYGLSAGVDYTVENWVFGASLGYADTDVDFDVAGADSEIDGYSFGLYTSYSRDNWYIDGGFTYVYSDIDTRREITGVDTVTADYDADTYGGYVGFGYKFECTNALSVTPSMVLAYSYYDQESYDESGIGGMDMDSFDQDSFTSTLGVKATYKFSDMLKANLRASWEHEYCDNQSVAKGSLYGARFTTKGLEPDDDSYVFGAGLVAELDEYTSAFLDYDYEIKDEADGHNVTLGVRFEF